MSCNKTESNNYGDKSDQELVFLSINDKDCFYHLVERYEAKLARYIRRITSVNTQDVEDILQDIFIKVYLNLREYNKHLSFSAWIYRISYNEVISRYRWYKRRPDGHKSDLTTEDFSGLLAIDEGFQDRFDQALDLQFLKKALDDLPLLNKQVIVLHYLEEKSYQEVSDIIKKPIGSVSSLIYRSKQRLKKKLSVYFKSN